MRSQSTQNQYSSQFAQLCPRCGASLTADRLVNGQAICACGWYAEKNQNRAERKTSRQTVLAMLSAAVVFLGIAVHLINWGPEGFSVAAIYLKRAVGGLDESGYLKLNRTCVALAKWNCAKQSYRDLYKLKAEAKYLGELAYLEQRTSEAEQATVTFERYFKAGGRDPMMLLRYARLLEAAGRDDDALNIYEAACQAQPPGVLPVQATSGLVKILIKHGQFSAARARIKAFHESASNANGYLNAEWAEVVSSLRGKTSNHRPSRQPSA